MTEQIHSCSYYCDRPECIKEQRDELRDGLENDSWVSVSDRLPEIGFKEYPQSNAVSIAAENQDRSSVAIYDYNFKEWFYFNTSEKARDVTHWHPLPKPPEGM
jgi:hypothetical protein